MSSTAYPRLVLNLRLPFPPFSAYICPPPPPPVNCKEFWESKSNATNDRQTPHQREGMSFESKAQYPGLCGCWKLSLIMRMSNYGLMPKAESEAG